MVRIQDSQSWHRGSIPLSTTRKASGTKVLGAFLVIADGLLCLRDAPKCRLLDVVLCQEKVDTHTGEGTPPAFLFIF